MNRRTFLNTTAAGAALFGMAPRTALRAAERADEWRADLVIIGGGLGGCAAALAALRAGLRVILAESTDWVGGQVTSQGVPPDEHPWIESFGCTRLYRQYRNSVRQFYRDHYPLTAEARSQPQLNPGNGWVSRLCHEPRVSLAVLEEMLAPYRSGRQLHLLLEHEAVSAEVTGDRVQAITVRGRDDARRVTLAAPYFVDATELGDLLPMTKTEYVTGAESQKDTGEPHAAVVAKPANQQAFTCCFAIDYLEGEDHTIEKPSDYDFWSRYLPELRPAWPGPLLSWRMSDPQTLKVREVAFDPTLKTPGLNLWSYRRIADAANFLPGTYPGSISLVNWPSNDYWLGPLVDIPAAEAAKHVQRAKQLSRSLLYWMQTEAPRPDGKSGWRGLRLREDVMGTADGLAKFPYVRESRRILAEFTVVEPQVGTEARMQATAKSRDEVTAASFSDSVGVGHYRIDLHPTTEGDNYLDLSCLPFQIPLGALLPRRMENLLPACKNIGTTHITNGAYRLHPVEWNIGEAIGSLVAFCLQQKEPPRQIRRDAKRLADFQQLLRRNGIELEWPKVRPL